MPADAIDRINLLAWARPAGMQFTNMRNDTYNKEIDSDDDSNDDDSDNDSEDESSAGNDDNYDDFIAGVKTHNLDPPHPPDADVDETHHNQDGDKDEDDGEVPQT
jgi:hypothetical protein